jgi:hypothetical protein
MHNLLARKRDLDLKIKSVLQNKQPGTKSERLSAYVDVRPMLREIKSINIAIDSCRKQLAEVIRLSLVEMGLLARESRLAQLSELSVAVALLVEILYKEEGFSLEEARQKFCSYQDAHHDLDDTDKCNYVLMIEKAISECKNYRTQI